MTPEASAINEMLVQCWPFMAVVGLLAIGLVAIIGTALQRAGGSK